MLQILVVEDSAESFELIRRSLGQSYSLVWAQTLAAAAAKLRTQKFSLILFDLMLPDGESFSLCSELQSDAAKAAIPVIFLTARQDIAVKVLAFAVGADDYMVKPFEGAELKARVTAKIKRYTERQARSENVRVGAFELQPASQRLNVIEQGTPQAVDVTPFEFKILLYLVKRTENVVTRDELKNALWGTNVHVDDRSVDTHISKLRRKLGTKATAIRSHHGFGYSFHVEDTDVMPTYFDTPSALPLIGKVLDPMPS